MGLFDTMADNDMREDQGRVEIPIGYYIVETIKSEGPESKMHPSADKFWAKGTPEDEKFNTNPLGYSLNLPVRIIGGPAEHQNLQGRVIFGRVGVREYEKKKISGQFIAALNCLVSSGVALDYPANDPERHRLRWLHTKEALNTTAEELDLDPNNFYDEPDMAHLLVCTAALHLAHNPGRMVVRTYMPKKKAGSQYEPQIAIGTFTDIEDQATIDKHNLIYYTPPSDDIPY